MLRVLPAQGKLILQQVTEWRNFFVWRDSRVLLCNQKSVFTQIAASFICCKTGLSVGGKTRNIAFQHVRQQWAHFCCPFYRSFRNLCILLHWVLDPGTLGNNCHLGYKDCCNLFHNTLLSSRRRGCHHNGKKSSPRGLSPKFRLVWTNFHQVFSLDILQINGLGVSDTFHWNQLKPTQNQITMAF